MPGPISAGDFPALTGDVEGAVLARAIPGNAPRATRSHEFAVEPIIEPFRRAAHLAVGFPRAPALVWGLLRRTVPFYYP